jgi:hypothetical protein
MSYRLGTAESRLAQLDASEVSEDLARQDAPECAPKPASVIVEAVVPDRSPEPADLLPEIYGKLPQTAAGRGLRQDAQGSAGERAQGD